MTDPNAPQEIPGAGPLSRRQALAAGGGLLAATAAGSIATASPTRAADTASVGTDPQQLASISLGQASIILKAAEQEAQRIGVPCFIVIVDVGGDLKAVSRQDGNSRASVTLAPLKAATSLAFRTPTATLAARTTDPVRAQSFLAAGFTLLGGGLPITHGQQVIGAIGVGGGSPEQDAQVAQAGLAALS